MTKIARSLMLFATCLTGSVLTACSGGDTFPTPLPTATPFVFPTPLPTATPFVFPTPLPTATPFVFPTALPTATPFAFPSRVPTSTPQPTATPFVFPTPLPTATPFSVKFPTPLPTSTPSSRPIPLLPSTPQSLPSDLGTGSNDTEDAVEDFAMCSGLLLDNMVVGLEVPLGNGQSKFGAGFLTNAPIFGMFEDPSDPSGVSNVRIIVTAAHLLANSQGYALLTYPRDDRFQQIRLEPHPHPHNKPNPRSTVNPLALRTPDDRPLAGVFEWLFSGLPPPTNKLRGDEVGVLGIGMSDHSDGNRTFHPTFAKGVISSVPDDHIVRINAQGYKGLSGGVIFDRECDLVGMVVGANPNTGEILAISDWGLFLLRTNNQTAFWR